MYLKPIWWSNSDERFLPLFPRYANLNLFLNIRGYGLLDSWGILILLSAYALCLGVSQSM